MINWVLSCFLEQYFHHLMMGVVWMIEKDLCTISKVIMNNKIVYVLCSWHENLNEQFYPIIRFLKEKYNKVIGVTLKSKNSKTSKNDNPFDDLLMFDNLFSLAYFIHSHKRDKMCFLYNHKEFNNVELKIYLSIKLSFANVLYFPRSIYFFKENINEIERKKLAKKIFYRTLIRKFIINVKIILVYTVLFPFLTSRKFREKTSKKRINKILFMRLDRFGDMVLTFSSIVALRKAYPDAEIQLLCSPMNAELVKTQNKLYPNLLDKIIVWEDIWDMHGGIIPGLSHFINMIKTALKLRKEYFDIVIQPIPISIWTLFALLLRSKSVIATINESLFLSRLLKKHVDNPVIIKRNEFIHCFKQSANCLLPLGINNVEKAELYYNPKELSDHVKRVLATKNIVINLSAGDTARKLPDNKIELLIRELTGNLTDYRIILIGTKEDSFLASNLEKKFPKNILNFVGKTGINDLIFILKHSDLLITPDTGTMHLASLTDIYIIAYFGPGNPKYFAPITEKCTIIKHELGCSGCGDICFTKKIPKPCIEATTVDEIFNAVKSAINKIKRESFES